MLSATKVVWRKPWVMLANAWVMLPLGLVLSFCLVGLPIAARALKSLAHQMLRNARALRNEAAPPDPEKSYAGSICLIGWAIASFAMVAAGGLAAHALGDTSDLVRLPLQLLAGGLGAVVVSAVVAPLLFAPSLAVDGSKGLFAPFARSFEVAARRGPKQSVLLGAKVGLALALPHLLLGTLAYLLSTSSRPLDSLVIAGPVAAWIGAPRVLALLSVGYVETPDVASNGAELGEAARLRSLAWMIAPALIMLLGALTLAAISPTEMRRGDISEQPVRGMSGLALGATPRVGRLPNTSVTVRTTAHGIVVEAADGGGAGALDAGFDTTQAALWVDQRSDDGVLIPEYRVSVRSSHHFAFTMIDADGVRLDDSIADRTFGRLGGFGSGALGLGMLLLLFLTFTVGVELGSARTMSAPALLAGEPRGRGSLAALEGTLRVGDGSRVFYSPPSRLAWLLGRASGALRVEGEAWVEADGGAIRFRLPDGSAEVLGNVSGEGWDGKHVVLLSTFASSGVAGLRTAASAWPSDGRLTLGTCSDARNVLVDRAVKRASRVALPMLLSFGLACAAVLLNL